MQFTELFTKEQITKMNEIIDFIFENIEPTLMDESICYIAVNVCDKKSELDKLPSGKFIMDWTIDGLKEIKNKRKAI